MSYQVLARKWRPGKFSELVGQEHVVTAISNALDNNRLHHAYLFTGTRGVGKTTIARIFAKSLNCETGLSANPCGQCGTCKDIEQGRFVDLLEIDAASRTKVDDTRELLDNVQYRPTQGDYKVYLIDEVHMLSKHSFNALLKTLEEPPPHVKFLLATTDPQKLPVTILSRCLQFNLKALSREQIQQQLSHVLTQEHIDHETGALAQLARAANGSMRDALSLTDQAIAQGNNVVSTPIVSDMLGLMDKTQILKLVHGIIAGDQDKVFEQVEELAQTAPNYTHVLDEIMSLLHQVAMTQIVPEACKLETISARAIYQLAQSVSKEQVQLLYQMTLQGKQDLPHSMDNRAGFEMILLRLLAFTPVTKIDDFVEIIHADMANHLAEVGPMITFTKTEVIEPQVVESIVDEPEVSQPQTIEPEVIQPEVIQPEVSQPEIHALQSEFTEIIEQASTLHPMQFSEESLPPEAYALEADNEDEMPIDLQIDQELQPKVQAVSNDALDALLNMRDQLDTADTTDNIADIPDAMPDTPDTPDAMPVSTRQTAEPLEAPSDDEDDGLPLAQPERDPAKMGLVQHTDTESVTVQHVSNTTLSAILPNGDKLTSAAQVDNWANMIANMQLSGLNKQLALHSAFSQEGNHVHLTLEQDKSHLRSDAAVSVVQEALSEQLGQAVTVAVEVGNPAETPYSLQMQINQIRKAHAETILTLILTYKN